MIRHAVRWNSSSPRLSALSLAIAMALGSPMARAATITVTDDTDPIPTASTTTCTLRQAIAAINNHAVGGADAGNCANSGATFGTSDTINFAAGVTAIDLDGTTNGELDIHIVNDLLINGGTSLGQVTVSLASGLYSVIGNRVANATSNLVLTGLTITGGNADGSGGGVYLGGYNSTLTLNNSLVTSNNSVTGGGVYAFNVVVNNSTISNNTTEHEGGGIYTPTQGQVVLTNSLISGNTAGESGGGIYTGRVTSNHGTVSGNNAGYSGGGVYTEFGGTFTDSLVTGNTASAEEFARGGGIYAQYEVLSLTNSTISDNTVSSDFRAICGGAYMSYGTLSLTNSTVSGNNGGALCAYTAILTNSTVTNNSGDYASGAAASGVRAYAVGLFNSTVSGNAAPLPAVYIGSQGQPEGFVPKPTGVKSGASLVARRDAVRARTQAHALGHRQGFAHAQDKHAGRTQAIGIHGRNLQDVNLTSNLTLYSSIVSENAGAHDIYARRSTVAAGGYNIIGNVGNTISLVSLTHEVSGSPLLGALADNGCAVTAGETSTAACVQTMALQPGSPAINTGSTIPSGVTTDERGAGFARPSGAAADIGAFEVEIVPPIADPHAEFVVFNTPLTFSLSGSDANPGGPFTLTYAPGASPSHGTVAINPTTGSTTYTPTTGYSGPDSFTYTVSDVNGTSTAATVTLTVGTPPTATPLVENVSFDTPLTFNLIGTDTNPNGPFTFTFAPGTGPTHGTITVTPGTGSTTYTPNNGYSGPDSFTYTVTDANGTSTPATVTLTVGVGTPPVATPLVENVSFDTPLTFSLLGTDTNPGGPFPFTFARVAGPTHGTITVTPGTGSTIYTPNTGYTGPDSFTYTVTDANGTSAAATVTINVAPGVLPIAQPNSASTTENTPVNITLTATDANPGTSPFTFAVGTPPAHGGVTLGTPTTTGLSTPASSSTVKTGTIQFSYGIAAANGTVTATYTPAANYAGADSFTFTASNANGTSAPATVTIAVAAAPATFTPEPAPALSTWAWGALIAQFGLIAWYRLRRFPEAAPKKKSSSPIE